MKKFFTFIAAALFAGSMMAEPIVINATDVTGIESGATSGLDVTLQGINIVWQGAYYNSDGGDGGSASVDFRVYANKSMTLTAESNISKVEIAGYCKAGLTVTANAGTITTGASYASETTKGTLEDPLIVVDEIGATSVTLTCTKQVRAYTLRITLDGDVPPVVADIYTVAGNDAAIFGTSWDVTNTANDMVKAAGIYKWEKAELNLTAGTIIAFKVAKNHSWDVAYPAQNDTVTIAEEGEYTLTITFDPATEAVAAEAVKKVALADPTNCAEAAAAALTVSANNEPYNNGAVYTIQGFVTAIQTAYSDQYHNITFWMADAADGGNVLEAFRAACAAEADAPKVGDKVAVTGSLTKYNTTPEFAAGCTFTIIERAEPQPEQEIETLTVAQAIEATLALENGATSTVDYIVEGYVVNAGDFSWGSKQQIFFLADDAANTAEQLFEAYYCTAYENNVAMPVLNGDKIQLKGKLTKYVKDEATTPEIKNGTATFITKVDGDRSQPTADQITVAQALAYGAEVAVGATSAEAYTIVGYVTAMVNSEDGGWAQYGNQIFWIADENNGATGNENGAFEVYQGVAPEELHVGDKVSVYSKIKNYNGLLETETRVAVTILEKSGETVEDADVVFTSADFNGQGTSGSGSEVTATKNGVTFTCDKAYGDQYGVRCYKNSVVTISSAEQQIGKIVFEFATVGSTYYNGDLDEEIVVNGLEWNNTMTNQARMNKIKIYFGEYEQQQVDTLTAAQALEVAQGLAVGATQKVVCKAYIASVKDAYSEEYGNITVWLTDDPASTYGSIQAYRAKCSAEDGAVLAEHDLVLIEGNVTHTQNQEGTKDYYEFASGAQLKLLQKASGIENVTLTEKVQKVVIDGVIYIVRDNKLFDVRGTQVR